MILRFSTLRTASTLGLLAAFAGMGSAQVPTFAGNSQHTQNYSAPLQKLNGIKWTSDIDLNNSGAFAHYGAPLVTASNTLLIPVKTASNGFQVEGRTNTGTLKYTLSSDYVLPTVGWIIPYQPVLTAGAVGTRVYYAGAGGTIYYVDDVDSNTPTAPVQLCFYASSGNATDLSDYTANTAGFNSSIFINSPITADSNGTIYFAFKTQGTAPLPINSTQSGIARIDASGNASYRLTGAIVGNNVYTRTSHGAAPALSNDEQTLYFPIKSTSSSVDCYLAAVDADSLATVGLAYLRDPRNGNGANVNDSSTASPMVAPDGDVYFGVLSNPYNGSRGWLLRFTSDLSVEKTPGGFGWDYTPGLVPASMVPSYTGTSSYLLYCKYNNYPINDGDGTNKVAILDPNATQIDPHPSASGLTQMREVLVMISPTRDNQYPSVPIAAREWCINASAVHPASKSIIFNCEDGRLYRWDLSNNSLSEGMTLNAGLGQPYVPTVIGPDGTVYTLNGGIFFAIGETATPQSMSLTSSNPDARTTVLGDNVTLTAKIHGISAQPLGTVTFTALTHNNVTPETTVLASNVPVDASGEAVVVTNAFLAGGAYLGNYHITAVYNGPESYNLLEASRYQKVHFSATTTTLATGGPTTYGSDVTLTATVASNPSGGGTPTGMVTFMEGTTILGQRPLDGSGNASFTVSGATMGNHSYSAVYNADTYFAMSTGGASHDVQSGTSVALGSSPNPSGFGQSAAFTATVTALAAGAGTPTGSVTFTEGATTLGTVAVNGSGQAVLNISTLSVGNHNITASFVGTGGFLDDSDSTSHDVAQATTTTTLGSTPNPSADDQLVTFTATVTSSGTPTGTVTFSEGATTLATVALNGSGQAIWSTSALNIGAHTITATYNGNANFAGSNDDIVQNVTIDNVPPSVPQNVNAVSGAFRGQITITWSPSTDPNSPVSHYEVWRANKATGPFSLLGTTTTTTFVDGSAGRGKRRYYYVIAVDTHGNKSAPSAIVWNIGAFNFFGGKLGGGWIDIWSKG